MNTSAMAAWLLALAALTVANLAVGTGTAQEPPAIGVDADPAGNTPTSLGPIDPCVSVNKGDTFEIDLFITNVSELKAWEVYLSFDGSIVHVLDRDVKLFQAANANSDVFDASETLPSSGGLYRLGALDFGQPDSGSGVLARLTLKAVGAGTSPVIIITLDANNDGKPDLGTRLKQQQEEPIGDTNGDEFFDGSVVNAQIAAERNCPGAPVETAIPSPHASPAPASPTVSDRGTPIATAATAEPATTARASPTPQATAELTPAIASPTPSASPAKDERIDWGSPALIAAYVAVGAVAVLAVGGIVYLGTWRRRS